MSGVLSFIARCLLLVFVFCCINITLEKAVLFAHTGLNFVKPVNIYSFQIRHLLLVRHLFAFSFLDSSLSIEY